MNRKLWALNIALALAAIYAGYQLQQEWAAKHARSQAIMRNNWTPSPKIRYNSQPVPPPVLPTTYNNIAQKLLLDRSRNPDVLVPPPPPPPAPPPPPPVPPLPGYHGSMNLDGPVALLSIGNGRPDAIHPGEMIGPFKLIDVNRTDIIFQWNDQLIKKSLDEVLVKSAAPQVAANNGNAVAPPMAVAAAPPVQKALGPGESTQFGFKTCQPNDSLPEGTVQDGYRKTLHRLPFGTSCTWDPIGGVPSK